MNLWSKGRRGLGLGTTGQVGEGKVRVAEVREAGAWWKGV